MGNLIAPRASSVPQRPCARPSARRSANEDALGTTRDGQPLRAALGDDRFAAAWNAGQNQSIELMIAEALEPTDPLPSIRRHAFSLTRREVQILGLLVAGKPDREIAEELTLSVRTVEHHVAHILVKLDVRTRTAAVSAAIAAGLAEPGTQLTT